MAIYLKYEGIKGNVTADNYKDHIAIKSVNFNVARNVSMNPGDLFNREASHPRISQVSITKILDNSCSAIFKESVSGSVGKTVVIKHVHTGSEKVEEFLEQTLENCIISNYAFTANDEGQPQEVFSLSFSKILINYKDHDSSNMAGGPARVGYDLETAKAL